VVQQIVTLPTGVKHITSRPVTVTAPQSAKSHWVNEEILAFKRMGGKDRILALIIEGEPNASDKTEFDDALECFPEAL